MDTPLEESNLAYIGSDEDKAAREAAANLEVDWEGCGQSEGIEIWRVENNRTESGAAPDFGINKWPKERYGEFHQGDSYIVLKTVKVEDALVRDIFFWIGSESSQDEYGVAAYKANELDDLFGDAPVQHRELEGFESPEFLDCFAGTGIKYLEGGVASGFRTVDADAATVVVPTRLYQVRKCQGSTPKSYMVPVSCSSLNQGDAFVLDANTKVYTWYGEEASPFEKNKAIEIATALVDARTGQSTLIQDVDDDVDAFWEALGGKGDIAPAEAVSDDAVAEHACKMYILKDDDSQLKVQVVDEPSASHLVSDDICMMDIGPEIIVWIGSGASSREQSQAMTMVGTYLKTWGREHNTRVTRVLEGQEGRCASWSKVFE